MVLLEIQSELLRLEERAAVAHMAISFTDVTPEGICSGAPRFSPCPVKKPRQWAAWTRQEEENFFNALRQVGKNFEKITCRVQSKNKDQVRHYYYRLVRRMNKLLGPGYCLDAKNSKDTIAAMLRWWSLLEKFSCTASKLRLKPRRLKTFVEAFESQLTKDRNKSRRKQPQGEMYTAAPASLISSKGLGAGNNEPCLGVDCPNEIKLPPKGSYKRASVDGNGNTNFRVGGTKGGLTSMKTVKQKRKGGMVGSAAYKKWEKAAIAGVSLVADAAEQLECGNLNKDHSIVLPNMMCSHNGAYCNNGKNAGVQSLMKLKLQLFPINEATRKALEKELHNPHLELTLSGRKRIASVLEHLNRKWGNSDVACGELVLLPYTANVDNFRSCQRWTLKDTVAAADVFVSVGSPSVFRLRYGWFTNSETTSSNSVIPQGIQTGKHFLSPTNRCFQQSVGCGLIRPNVVEEVGGNQENYVACTGDTSARAWADSLTNISVGYLFSEASRAAHLDCAESSVNKDMAQIDEAAHSIDSFEATIAAHLSTANNMSLFGAEETRDGFSYEAACTNNLLFQQFQKDISGNMASNDNDLAIEEAKEDHNSEAKDSSSDDNNDNASNDTSFTDIYWPDSLGPLDLDVPPIRYQCPELGFSDSFNSLTRMLASSSDALRNSSFLGTADN